MGPTVSLVARLTEQGSYVRASTRSTVPDDVPSDVQAVLTQLFEETEAAIRAGRYETARQTVTTVETVSRNKLPAGELRATLLHGCGEVVAEIEQDDSVDADIAAEYVRAMTHRLPAER